MSSLAPTQHALLPSLCGLDDEDDMSRTSLEIDYALVLEHVPSVGSSCGPAMSVGELAKVVGPHREQKTASIRIPILVRLESDKSCRPRGCDPRWAPLMVEHFTWERREGESPEPDGGVGHELAELTSSAVSCAPDGCARLG